MSDVPGELVPDEHVKICGADGESYRCDLEIESLDAPRRGGVITGVTPPFYAPTVEKAGPVTYRVLQAGNPEERVNIDRRTCTCETAAHGGWCFHLKMAVLYHHREVEQ